MLITNATNINRKAMYLYLAINTRETLVPSVSPPNDLLRFGGQLLQGAVHLFLQLLLQSAHAAEGPLLTLVIQLSQYFSQNSFDSF
jgi:hypothetical protein